MSLFDDLDDLTLLPDGVESGVNRRAARGVIFGTGDVDRMIDDYLEFETSDEDQEGD